ncbi:hypothetical protein ACHAXT_007978 [Thalassiosira profunda]
MPTTARPTPNPTERPTGRPTAPPTATSTPRPTPPPTPPSNGGGLSPRDIDWIDSHNKRRKEWHERYATAYIPLQWSSALEESSRQYAEVLISTGQFVHDPNNDYGENLGSNVGGGMLSTEDILARWVEGEADDPYPQNGHLTQVLWRATEYVGCGEASGGDRHVQVCRYARPGNCNMATYLPDWQTPTFLDTSPCGPFCPPDGCN